MNLVYTGGKELAFLTDSTQTECIATSEKQRTKNSKAIDCLKNEQQKNKENVVVNNLNMR